MVEGQIYVDGEIFLGRLDEQTRFRKVVEAVFEGPPEEVEPYVFVLRGPPGIGKSKLIRRLRDIVATEAPYESGMQTMLLDWELVNFRYASEQSFQIADQVDPIFVHMYNAARDAGWGHQFSDYQAAVRQLTRAEKLFSEAQEIEGWGKNFESLRSATLENLARIIRLEDLPVRQNSGNGGQPGGETASQISPRARGEAEQWIAERVALDDEEEELFRRPNHCLAERLAMGFATVAEAKPLVCLLDAYQLVQASHAWVQEIIRHAGPRVVWIVAIEDPPGPGRSTDGRGSTDFLGQVSAFELSLLSEDHVALYLQDRSPDRLATRTSVEHLYTATRGIPLAVQLAGDLWAGGVTSAEIIADIPRDASDAEILRNLSLRLLQYCDEPEDYTALVYLAVQPRPNDDILGAVLLPNRGAYDIRQRLRRLRTRYRSIIVDGGVRLNKTAAASLADFLLKRRVRLHEELRRVARRAAEVSGGIREEAEASFPRLEDRFNSLEWREATLVNLFWQFLFSEFDGWRQMVRDFVDALGYDRYMAAEMLELMQSLEAIFSKNGRQRLRVYQSARNSPLLAPAKLEALAGKSADQEYALIAELERWLARFGNKDMYDNERQAILDLRRGELSFYAGRHEDALNMFLRVEKNLPAKGEMLIRELSEMLEYVGDRLAWVRKGDSIIGTARSPSAELSLKKAIALGRRRPKNYYTLGAVQEKLGKLEAALENLLQAVTLNPDIAEAWNHLGDVYRKQELFEKAVPAYRRAIEMDPSNVRSHLRLGASLRTLSQDEELRKQLGSLAKLLQKTEDDYARACFAALIGQANEAIQFLQRAVAQGQVSAEMMRQEPCFDFIRDEPRFQSLV